MATISSLSVQLGLDNNSFITGLADARREANLFKKEISPLTQLGEQLQSVGAGLTIGVTAPLLAIGAAAVSAAADAEESQSKFDAVFKDMSGSVSAWADDHAEATNRSAIDLRDYAATLQDTFVPLGFARDKAAEMSTALVDLGVDLASFNNRADPEVINNLTSAIVGNHEAVRSFGIVITQATLNQELFNMGIAGGAKEATEQEKALARMNIIVSSTSDAQGDAARTAESFTNQVKGLTAKLKDAGISIGNVLIPPLSAMIGWFNSLLDAFNNLSPEMKTFIVVLGGLAAAIGPVLAAIGTLTLAIPALIAAMGPLVAVAGPIALLTIGLGAAAAAVIAFKDQIGSALLFALSKAVGGLASFAGGASKLASALGLTGIGGSLNGLQQSLTTTAQRLDDTSTNLLTVERGVGTLGQTTGAAVTAQTDLGGALDETTTALESAEDMYQRVEKEIDAANKSRQFEIDLIKDTITEIKASNEENLKASASAIDELLLRNQTHEQVVKNLKAFEEQITADLLTEIGTRHGAVISDQTQLLMDRNKAEKDFQLKLATDELKAINDRNEAAEKEYDKRFNDVKGTFKDVMLAGMKGDWDGFIKDIGKKWKDYFINTFIVETLSDFGAKLLTPLVSMFQDALANLTGGLFGQFVGGGAGAAGQAASGAAGSAGAGGPLGAAGAFNPATAVANIFGGALGGFIGGLMNRKANGIISGGVEEIKHTLNFISPHIDQMEAWQHEIRDRVNDLNDNSKDTGPTVQAIRTGTETLAALLVDAVDALSQLLESSEESRSRPPVFNVTVTLDGADIASQLSSLVENDGVRLVASGTA